MADEITLEKINIEIEANSDKAASGIDKLTASLSKLQSVLGDASKGLGKVAGGLRSIAKAMDSIDLGKLREMNKLLEKMAGLRAAGYGEQSPVANNYPQLMEQNPIIPDAPSMTAVEGAEWRQLQDALAQSQKELAEEMNAARDGMSQAQREIQKAGDTANDTASALNGAGKAAQEAGKKAKESKTKWEKLKTSMGNIAFYRAVRQAIKMVTAALKEGIQNYAMYSDEFNETMSNLTSELSQLKNALGAAIAPIIEALEPVLETLMDVLIDAANGISYLFAILSGSDSVTIATRQQQDYRDSIEETKKSLMGFDQINALSDNDSTDYSTMFETISLADVGVVDIVESISKLALVIYAIYGMVTSTTLLGALKKIGGVLFIIQGMTELISVFTDDWTDAEYEQAQTALEGIALTCTGLSLILDGIKATVLGIVGGFTMLASGFMDASKNGLDLNNSIEIVIGTLMLMIPLFKQIKAEGTSCWITIGSAMTSAVSIITAIIAVFTDWTNDVPHIVGACLAVASAVMFIAGAIMLALQKYARAANLMIWAAAIPAMGATICMAAFATGGFPDEGQLFIANEAGPELVGTMGGHTAVANNDQIVEGIKQGVREALEESNVGGDITVQFVQDGQIKASKIISAAERANQRAGKVVMEVNA